MSTTTSEQQVARAAATAWAVDPSRSRVEFRVRHFWGLVTVTGHFDRFEGTYSVAEDGRRIELRVDADSLDTGNGTRDKHLRSADFFDVVDHPQVRFDATQVSGDVGGRLRVSGDLEAAGETIPLSFAAVVRELGEELELEATTTVDHRRLGMTWSPLGMLRAPATLQVKARLRRA